MIIVCNRFNPQWVIRKMNEIGCSCSVFKRWQLSIQHNNKYFDFFFVTKPTRKQIKEAMKSIM